jgi:hypothetical protein
MNSTMENIMMIELTGQITLTQVDISMVLLLMMNVLLRVREDITFRMMSLMLQGIMQEHLEPSRSSIRELQILDI